MPGYATRRPANNERVSISRRGVDGLLLQPLVYQTLLKERRLASHVQQHLLSMQICASSASKTAKRQFSSICHPLMLCANTSLLMTSRSMPGWFHSTLQRWQPFRSQIQTYIKSLWMETLPSTRTRSHSLPLGWIMLLSTSTAS